MIFLLQYEDNEIDTDVNILKKELEREKFLHEYYLSSTNIIKIINDKSAFRDIIPVGNLNFVRTFLKIFHNINDMNSIEIPEVLREDIFLKRKYSIIEKSELPDNGYYFVKYVSELKSFTYTGLIETLKYDSAFLRNGLYQVSEVINILSEYRCFVHNDKIVAIHHYDGDCTIFPDISFINYAISTYSKDKTRPKAYTMDLAIIKDKGTAIIEIHAWVSVGLYGYIFDCSLPYCYRDGFRWYVEHNNKITKFSNF